MRILLFSAAVVASLAASSAAQAACGDITLSEFSWQSNQAMANVDRFILTNGYGCNVNIIAGDTVPTLTAMIEKGQPDVAPEATPSVVGELYAKGVAEGRIGQIGTVLTDRSMSGWYIPQYVADAHPDITTVQEAMKHPELFPSPEDPSKGAVIQGPQGWGDTVVTAQLYKAMDGDAKGFTLIPTGSAAALDGAITKAYEQKQAIIAQYYAPSSLLAKYPMVLLKMAHDPAEWARCTTVQDCPDPKPNYWQETDVVTVATGDFIKRVEPPVKDYFAKRGWSRAEVSKVMLWMTENQANGEDGAKWFIKNMPEVWTKWVPADVAEKIKAAL